MRIAYITHTFPPTGFAAAINTYRIVKGLAERGHELSVFCSESVSRYDARLELPLRNTSNPFIVHRSLRAPLPLSTTIPHLFNALKAAKYQHDLLITQFHLWHLATFAGLLSRISKGKPWFIRVHDMIPDPTLSTPISKNLLVNSCYGIVLNASYGVFLKNLGKKADKLLVLTNDLRNLLLKSGYFEDEVVVIPNGVDSNMFSPTSLKRDSIEKTILYVGSMMPEDGLSSLVKAFALLKEKDLKLTLIGDGPERFQLIDLVKKLNLAQKVAFYKYVPHKLIPEFIREAHIAVGPLCVSPINYFTIPTKILEYFACEKPVVSAPLSKDVLIDEVTGLVVKEITPKRIAEKFSIMIEDEKLVDRIKKKARQLVIEQFEWERVIDHIEAEIRKHESHRSD